MIRTSRSSSSELLGSDVPQQPTRISRLGRVPPRARLAHRGRQDALRRRLGAVEDRHLPALAHDQDPVAHGEDLGQVGADQDDRDAFLGELVDDLVDLGLGPDVDPARGLVEDEHARMRVQPLAQHDLLLVAARQRGDRHLDRRRRGCAGGRGSAPRRRPRPIAGSARVDPGSGPGSAARCWPRSTAGRRGPAPVGPRSSRRCAAGARPAGCGS